jgi:hypothetical protein
MTLFEFSCQLTRVQAALIKHGVEEEKRLAILDEITKGMIEQIESVSHVQFDSKKCMWKFDES